MKHLFFISLLVVMTGLVSCNSQGGRSSTLTRATGIAYEVIVVMDKVLWDGNVGSVIREEITSPIPFLPQDESSMRYTYVRPDLFNGMFLYVRNILIVNIDNTAYTKVSLLHEADKWANGQAVVYLHAPDHQSVEAYFEKNQQIIVNFFTKEEMKRTANFLRTSYSTVVMEKVKDKFGITINAPSELKYCNDKDDDCLWFSNKATRGRMDMLVYSFPYTDKNTFTLDYLIAKRDSFTKQVVPGSFVNSYMTVEKRVVDYQASMLNGKYCGVLRGLWRTEGDMMGGPFVSYARVDEPNRRIIVTEGFVYAPEQNKRNYIRRLEAALHTTLLPDEL